MPHEDFSTAIIIIPSGSYFRSPATSSRWRRRHHQVGEATAPLRWELAYRRVFPAFSPSHALVNGYSCRLIFLPEAYFAGRAGGHVRIGAGANHRGGGHAAGRDDSRLQPNGCVGASGDGSE